MWRSAFRMAQFPVLSYVYLSIASHHIGCIALLAGPSMNPSINIGGEMGIIDIVSWKHLKKEADYGDIIVLKSPISRDKLVMKRLIAKENDTIFSESGPVTVPKGHVWVEGDNASNSVDSRFYGPVSQSLIQGFLFAKIDTTWTWTSMHSTFSDVEESSLAEQDYEPVFVKPSYDE